MTSVTILKDLKLRLENVEPELDICSSERAKLREFPFLLQREKENMPSI